MEILLVVAFQLIAIAKTACAALGTSSCGLLGPQYPMPQNFSKLKYVEELQANTVKLIEDATFTGKTSWGPVDTVDTSFSLAVFSSDTEDLLFEYHHVGSHHGAALSGDELDQGTLYRIGSISKLITVYTMLARLDAVHWNDPLVKYIPDLVKVPDGSGRPTDHLHDWSEVTLGALASHLGGIARDYGFFDTAVLLSDAELGVPPLNPKEVPQCGKPTGNACTLHESLKLLQLQNPVSEAWLSPIYSNEAFSLIGLAVEAITGESFEQTFLSFIARPLNLERTFWKTPPSNVSNVLDVRVTDPVNGYDFWYDQGNYIPTSGVYTSLGDLCAIGRSILRSDIIPPSLTKKWMKPSAMTGHLHSAVGMPWEIVRMEVPVTPKSSNTRLVDLYTKSGGLGAYSSQLILSPDHGLGVSVLVASNASNGLGKKSGLSLSEILLDTWVLGAEEASRKTAGSTFAGSYTIIPTAGENMSLGETMLQLSMQPDRRGIYLERFIYNGTDILSSLVNINGAGASGRDLQFLGKRHNGRQIMFRAIWSSIRADEYEEIRTKYSVLNKPCQNTWASVDMPGYANHGLDEFIFELHDDGSARLVILPALRMTLTRVKEAVSTESQTEDLSYLQDQSWYQRIGWL